MSLRSASLTAILLLFGVAGVADAVSAALRRKYPPPGILVTVDSHKLHLYCTGNGNPPIVFESGLGTDWTQWRLVIPPLSASHKVCVYDRAGYGWSEAGPKPRTASRLAAELYAVLGNAGMPAPYVLVAHSFGAYDARLFAARFSRSLQGVVLVDPLDENEPKLIPSAGRRIHYLLPPTGLAGLLRLYGGERAVPAELRSLPPAWRDRYTVGASYREAAAERAEYEAMAESESQVHASVFPRDLPLTILTATYVVAPGHGNAPAMNVFSGHIELQAALARMSSRGKQIVAPNSGHTIQLDRPELVVRAIQEMASS